MKSIIVFSHLYKPHLGGLEKYVEKFYSNLPKETKITIITSKYLPDLFGKEIDDNITIVRLDCIEVIKGKYFIPSIRGIKQIKEVFESENQKNCHVDTHTRFYLTNVIATYFAKRYRLSHYHFEHGSSFVKDGSLLVRFFAYMFDKTFANYVLKSAKLVFPISLSVKKFLQKNFKSLKYGPVIYNSFEFKDKTLPVKSKPKKLKLLFVGRVIKSKGIYELIDACKLLSDENFPYSLTIIGEGTESDRIKKYIEKKSLEKKVFVRGALPFDKTQEEYTKHDMLVNPSYTEGLPTTVLEGLANGLLIVATDVGGTREIMNPNDLINPKILTPKNLYKKIKNFYEKWEEKYTKLVTIHTEAAKRFEKNINKNKYLKSIAT